MGSESLVARRSSLVALSIVVVLVASGVASGQNLQTGSQVGVSLSYSPYYATVWSRDTSGHPTALTAHPAGPSPSWAFYNLTAGAQGLTATGWQSGGSTYERAYFVNNNSLTDIAMVNGAFEAARVFNPPSGTMTGYLSATRRFNNNAWESVVFVTIKVNSNDTGANLWVFTRGAGAVGTWLQLTTGSSFSPSKPLSASSRVDGLYARVFLSTIDVGNQMYMVRWTAGPFGAWLGVPLSTPGGQVCGDVAAAEGDTGAPGGYQLYAFCTRRNLAVNQLWYRRTSTAGGENGWGTWTALTVPSGNAPTSGYAIAATASLAQAGKYSIEVFLRSTTGALSTARHSAGAGSITPLAALGSDGETSTRLGGLAATPGWLAVPSRLYYHGVFGSRARLYSRVGDPAQPGSAPGNWADHGSGNGRVFLASSGRYTENSTAFFQGTVVNVAMTSSQFNNQPREVHARWSSDDGATWSGPLVLPRESSQAGDVNTYVADPSVALGDDGTAWISLFGVDRVGDWCPNVGSDTEIFYTTMVGPGAYSAPQRLVYSDVVQICTQGDGMCPGTPGAPPGCTLATCDDDPDDDCYCRTTMSRWDHPWVAIERRAGNDRVHFVWTDRIGDAANGYLDAARVHYVQRTAEFSGLGWLLKTDGDYLRGGAPVVSVGAGGATYVGTDAWLCRVDEASWNEGAQPRCSAEMAYEDDLVPRDIRSQAAPDDRMPVNDPSGNQYVDVANFSSIVASPSDPNVVYYAFQRLEADGQRLDVQFSRIVLSAGQFTSSPPINLTDVADDGFDQFQPELTVGQGLPGGDTVFASWYDRRPTGAGGVCATANRCYQPMRSVAFNGGLSGFLFTDTVPVDDQATPSDPALLPGDCRVLDPANYRFLGDFHHVTGDLLHSAHVVVGAPTGSPAETGTLTQGWVSSGHYGW